MNKLYVGQVITPVSEIPQTKKILILDCSGSMSSFFGDLRNFLNDFYMKHGEFTLFRFGSNVSVDEIKLFSDIPPISSLGGTNVAGVINTVSNHIRHTQRSRSISILWVSDGQPDNFNEALRSIEYFKRDYEHLNINIVSCNYGLYADTRIATALASVTEGSIFKSITENQISTQSKTIFSNTSNPMCMVE